MSHSKPDPTQQHPRRTNKKDNASYRRALKGLCARACRQHGWFTGIAPFAYGLGMLAFAIGVLASPKDVSWAMALLLPLCLGVALGCLSYRLLRNRLVYPSGMIMLVDINTQCGKPSLTLAAVLYFILTLMAYDLTPALFPGIAVGCVCGIFVVLMCILKGPARLEEVAALAFLLPAAAAGLLFETCAAVQLVFIGVVLDGLVLTISGFVIIRGMTNQARGGIAADKIMAWLKKNPRQQAIAFEYMNYHVPPETLGALIALCESKNETTAFGAQYALAGVWGPDPLEGLKVPDEAALNDALEGMSDGMASRMSYLVARRKQDDLQQRRGVEAAMEALAHKDEAALDVLLRLVEGQGVLFDETQQVVLDLLGCCHHPRANEALVKNLLSQNDDLETGALRGFCAAGLESIETLRPLMSHEVAWVRKRVISAVYHVLDYVRREYPGELNRAYDIVAQDATALCTHNDTVTQAYAMTILNPALQETAAFLRQRCKSERMLLRGEALQMLTIFLPELAKDEVLSALADERAYVRLVALTCIMEMRPPEMVGALTFLAQDVNPLVAQMAQRALTVVEPKQ